MARWTCTQRHCPRVLQIGVAQESNSSGGIGEQEVDEGPQEDEQ
jgi:hypothetical protein